MEDEFMLRKKLQVDSSNLEEARSYETQLQNYGRSLIASLYMLIRNVRLYEPDNAIFNKPLEQLKDTINTIIALDGKLLLQGAGSTFYLNNMLLRFDSRSYENVDQLSREFEERDVGGFELNKPIEIEELQQFVFLFKKEGSNRRNQDGLAARELSSLKVSRFSKIKEVLQGKTGKKASKRVGDPEKIDRKKYSMLVYARLVQFMRKYIEGLRGQGPSLLRKNAFQLIQDMVDITQNRKSNFIGMTTATDPLDAYCFHTASVATISIIFGSVLRLRRDQLRDLGMSALFHDIGRVGQDNLMPETPTDGNDKRWAIQVRSVKRLLIDGPLNRGNINVLLASFESQVDYGTEGKGPHRFDLGLFAKIIALADCYDYLATNDTTDASVIMEIMSTNLKHKFDPFLLRLFAKSMNVWTATSKGQKIELI